MLIRAVQGAPVHAVPQGFLAGAFFTLDGVDGVPILSGTGVLQAHQTLWL